MLALRTSAGSTSLSGNRSIVLAALVGLMGLAVLLGLVSAAAGGEIAALAMIGLALFAVTLFAFKAGLMVLCFLMPLAITSLMPRKLFGVQGLNPFNILIVGVALSYFVWRMRKRSQTVPMPWIFWLYFGLICAAGAVGFQHAGDIPAGFQLAGLVTFDGAWGYITAAVIRSPLCLLIVYMLAQATETPADARRFLMAGILGATAIAIFDMILLLVGGGSLAYAASGDGRMMLAVVGIHPNTQALTFNLAFAVALYLWFEGECGPVVKTVLLGCMGVLAIGLFFTFSRGGYLAFAVTAVAFLIWQRNYRTLIIGGVLILVLLLLLPSQFYDRISTGVGTVGGVDAVSAGRWDGIWRPLLPEVFVHPFTGGGLYSTLWAKPQLRGEMLPVGQPHNAYLGTFLDFGLIGCWFIFGFLVFIARRFSAVGRMTNAVTIRAIAHGGLAAVIVLFFQGATDDKFVADYHQSVLWIAIAVALAQRRHLQPLAPVRARFHRR